MFVDVNVFFHRQYEKLLSLLGMSQQIRCLYDSAVVIITGIFKPDVIKQVTVYAETHPPSDS